MDEAIRICLFTFRHYKISSKISPNCQTTCRTNQLQSAGPSKRTWFQLSDYPTRSQAARTEMRPFVPWLPLLGTILHLLSAYVPGSFCEEEKTFLFALGGDLPPYDYLKDQKLRGFTLDLIESVCLTAGKDCRVVYDPYENCWGSSRGE